MAPGAAPAATEDMNFGRPEFPGCTRTLLTPAVAYGSDVDNVVLDREVTVSPPAFESPLLEDGERFVCTVTIRSRFERRATLELRAVGIVGSRSPRTTARFLDADDPDAATTAASWLEPVVDEVTLDPRGIARVPIILTVPDDPPAGGAYGGIAVIAKSEADGPGETIVGVESQVVASFLLRTDADGAPELELRDTRAPRLRWNRDPWTLRAKLDNTGSLHAVPRGRVRIRSLFGNVVNELKFEDVPLLPGGRARIVRTWDDVPWFGLYRWDLRVASAPGSSPADVVRARGWFIALPPWWVLAIAAALLAFAIAGAIARRRHEDDDAAWDDDDQDSYGNNEP